MSPDEQPKVAAYQSRRMAISNSLIHVVPLGGSAILLLLHWTKLWAGKTTDNATTLQFVAKLHELFMQASLVDLLLYLIRAQALSDFVPLGSLSAAAGQQLSFLWSLDFLSAIVSPVFITWRKIWFALSVVILFALTAVVGPSSAVLMIPRPGIAHVNSTATQYLNTPEASLFPDLMKRPIELNFTQIPTDATVYLGPSRGRDDRILARTALRDDQIIGRNSFIRWHIYSSSKPVFDGEKGQTADGEYSIHTVPTVLSAAVLYFNHQGPSSVMYDRDATNANWTLHTWQPLVLAACANRDPLSGMVYYVRDDGSKSSLPNVTDFLEHTDKFQVEGNINFASGTTSVYRPIWIPSPEVSAYVVGVFADEHKTVSGELTTGITVCTLSSFWRKSLTTMTVTDMGPMVEADLAQTREAMARDDLKPITIILEDMPTLLRAGDSLMGSGNIREVDSWGNPAMLAMRFALALSAIHYTSIDAQKVFGLLAANPPLDDIKQTDRSNLTFFKIDELIQGYAYGSTDTSILLSLVVVISYCAVTLVYITYLITTGHTPTAWSSATEFVMLALQSQPADDVKNVSVGIDTMNTFRRSVGIRVKEEIDEFSEQIDEKLELVFADEKDVHRRGLRKVVRNKAY